MMNWQVSTYVVQVVCVADMFGKCCVASGMLLQVMQVKCCRCAIDGNDGLQVFPGDMLQVLHVMQFVCSSVADVLQERCNMLGGVLQPACRSVHVPSGV